MLNMLTEQDADQNGLSQETTNNDVFFEIPVSALTIEKINQNLFKANEFHDENSRKSWSEASRYYAAK